MMDIIRIAEIVGGALIRSGPSAGPGPSRAAVTVSTDTRTLGPGDLFFALRGESHDGHAFLAQASGRGAMGAVVSQVPDHSPATLCLVVVPDTLRALQDLAAHVRRESRAKVIAITGSCGKTTTKEMVSAMAEGAGAVVATRGNENNHIGLPLTLLRAGADTDFIVAEMGCNHWGEIALLTALADPDVGLVTCVAATHTEFLGDLEGVARAKSELFTGMRPDSTSVVNLDDPRVRRMALRSRRRLTYTAGSGEEADVRLLAAGLEPDGSGQRLSMRVAGRDIDLRLALPGRHNAANAAAAAAAALAAGLGVDRIAEGLEKVRPLKGRGGVHVGRFVIVDEAYNASPAAVTAALENLAAMPAQGKRLAVLGDMLELGERSVQYHEDAGREAAARADRLVAVGRFAEPMAEGARSAGMDRAAVLSCAHARDAVEAMRARPMVFEGDVVLVKGSRAVKMEIIVDYLLALQAESSMEGAKRGTGGV
jgi:UDP-N-acetylmuramoyl-tripeptide--D-alanyl-D-alanine ligase